jgi:hypothetical protein
MNKDIRWPEVIEQIVRAGVSLTKIADECGFSSAGALHDLKSGRSPTCTWERGAKLIDMHTKVTRRRAARKKAAGKAA